MIIANVNIAAIANEIRFHIYYLHVITSRHFSAVKCNLEWNGSIVNSHNSSVTAYDLETGVE
jgi:hypothetical protein